MTISVASIFKEQMVKFKRKNFYDARLPFLTRTVQIQGDNIEMYVIPDEKKAAVLKELYPFIPVPALDEEMYDVHEEKKFRVKDFYVTREGGMNLLVSPYYFECGGTVIDWMPVEFED